MDGLQVQVRSVRQFIHCFREQRPREDGRPELQLGCLHVGFSFLLQFFSCSFLSFYLLPLFLRLINSCFSETRDVWKTLQHEFPTSRSHTECYLLFTKRYCLVMLYSQLIYVVSRYTSHQVAVCKVYLIYLHGQWLLIEWFNGSCLNEIFDDRRQVFPAYFHAYSIASLMITFLTVP